MKHLFIVNPIAGGRDRTEAVRLRVEELFRNRSDKYEIYVTRAAMDAPEKIRRELPFAGVLLKKDEDLAELKKRR